MICLKKLLFNSVLLAICLAYVSHVVATDEPITTWRIEAVAVCPNGSIPANATQLALGSIPPVPPRWYESKLQSGSHYKDFSITDRTQLVVAGLHDEFGNFLEPIAETLNKNMERVLLFNDSVWAVTWRQYNLPSGTYQIQFSAPSKWCPNIALPAPTCVPRPACLDTIPPCKPLEPAGGFCPAPTATEVPVKPTETPTTTPTEIPSVTPTITITVTPPPVTSGAPSGSLPDTGVCTKKSEGDADCNDVINLQDFSLWRQEYIEHTAGTPRVADFNTDEDTTLADFQVWRTTYIQLNPSPAL